MRELGKKLTHQSLLMGFTKYTKLLLFPGLLIVVAFSTLLYAITAPNSKAANVPEPSSMMYPVNRTVKWRENQWIEKRYEKQLQPGIQSESGARGAA